MYFAQLTVFQMISVLSQLLLDNEIVDTYEAREAKIPNSKSNRSTLLLPLVTLLTMAIDSRRGFSQGQQTKNRDMEHTCILVQLNWNSGFLSEKVTRWGRCNSVGYKYFPSSLQLIPNF